MPDSLNCICPAQMFTQSMVVFNNLHRYVRKVGLFVAFFSVLTVCQLSGPKLGFGEVPCVLNYPNNAVLGWNGKVPGKNVSHDPKAFKIYAHDCIGIRVEEGVVTVQWLDRNALLRQKSVQAITILTESILKDAQSSPLLERFHVFWIQGIANLCRHCSGKYSAGARGSENSIAQALYNALSGVLVVGPQGLELPLRESELRNITTFRIFTGDINHKEVDKVTHDTAMIRIDSKALFPEESYVWEARIQEAGKQQLYSGGFEVAGEGRAKATLAKLAEIRESANAQMTLEQEAAFYFEQGLPSNATIALMQWFKANSQEN